jgi:hypothetical protein
MTLFLRAFGDLENVRKAMSAACSHRHSIVVTHGPEYFANCISQLSKRAIDNVIPAVGSTPFREDRKSMWRYHLTLEGKNSIPHIRFHSKGKDATYCPLFQFLRVKYRRTYEVTAARKKNPGGRPREHWLRNDMWRRIENLTPAQRARYERLANARAAKAHKAAAKHQATTVNAAQPRNGDALGLKDKRKRRVDFTGVIMPNPEYGETLLDLDRVISEDWGDSQQ